jgi:glycosyltransferase involved in cell wall biosynthesis
MAKPLRILLVSPLPPPAGGIARWTEMIMEHAARVPDIEISVLNTALRRRTIQQSSARQRIAAGVPQMLGAIRALVAALRSRKPDVIHINSSGQFSIVRDLALTIVARRWRVPVIYHIRFGRVPEIASTCSAEWNLLAATMRRSAYIIALDYRTRDTICQNLPAAMVELIPNCVDVERCDEVAATLPENRPPKYVLFAAWVIPAKGVEELLNVWYGLTCPGWKLVLAGGYDRSYLESIGVAPGERDDIEFLGEVSHDQVLSLMLRCELFVLPSHTEGFPNSILEAMAFRKAVLATGVGAIGEMLKQGCGRVVRPKSTGELMAAMSDLLGDDEGREMMGHKARARVDAEYSLHSVFDRYRALWESAALGEEPISD